jgi:hypothetical protein
MTCCAICLGAIDGKQFYVSMRCKHVFHMQCMKQWLRSGGDTCPCCRDRVDATSRRTIMTYEEPSPKNVRVELFSKKCIRSGFWCVMGILFTTLVPSAI